MSTINIHEAKTHLSKLIEMAMSGKEIIIGKHGKPMVKLMPLIQRTKRKPGFWESKVKIADDFDELPNDIAAAFDGENP